MAESGSGSPELRRSAEQAVLKAIEFHAGELQHNFSTGSLLEVAQAYEAVMREKAPAQGTAPNGRSGRSNLG